MELRRLGTGRGLCSKTTMKRATGAKMVPGSDSKKDDEDAVGPGRGTARDSFLVQIWVSSWVLFLDLRTLVQVTGCGPGNQSLPGSGPGEDKATEHQLQPLDTGVRKSLALQKCLYPGPPLILFSPSPTPSGQQETLGSRFCISSYKSTWSHATWLPACG